MLFPILLLVCGIILIRLRESFLFDGLAIIVGLILTTFGVIAIANKFHIIWTTGKAFILLIMTITLVFILKRRGKRS